MTGRPLHVLVVGQTPPPFGGQAVMMQAMLEGRYEGVVLHHVRMAFSEDMESVHRFQPRKLVCELIKFYKRRSNFPNL